MVAVAVRRKMNIGVVGGDGGGLDRITLRSLLKFLAPVVHLLRHQITLFDPTFHSRGGAHLHVAAIAVQNFHAFSVLNYTHLVVNCRHLIAEDRLWRGNVGGIARVSMMMATRGKNDDACNNKK